MVRLTSDSLCTYNHLGELCENLNLLDIETCRLFEQVPLLLAALFSTFSHSHARCDCWLSWRHPACRLSSVLTLPLSLAHLLALALALALLCSLPSHRFRSQLRSHPSVSFQTQILLHIMFCFVFVAHLAAEPRRPHAHKIGPQGS
jgi:hypothetical protein